MATIPILVAVDGSKLAQQVSDGSLKAGSQGSPTSLGSYSQSDVYISMITQHSSINNDNAGSELTVNANSGDTIRWSMTSFDGNQDYTAYIYNAVFNPSANFSALTFLNIQYSSYLPPGSDPKATPTLVHNTAYDVQGTVLKYGTKIQYNMSFVLVDNSTGKIVGWFIWDPFINVSA